MERQELCMSDTLYTSNSPKNKTKTDSPNAASPYKEDANTCRMKRASNKNIETVNVESIAACKMQPSISNKKPSMRRITTAPVDDSKTTIKVIQSNTRGNCNYYEHLKSPRAYESMFSVPVASKFGGLKSKSKMMDKVSAINIDDEFSNESTLILDLTQMLCTFQ